MENQRKHSLGHRAFFLFLFRRLKGVIFLLIVVGAAWWGERWVPAGYLMWSDYAVKLLSLVTCAYFFFVFLQAVLEYRFYTYMFTDEAFIMTHGYIMRNEVAALYHQIQNVNIRRSPLHRLAGVSEVVILMTGSDRESPHNKIVLPAVGRTKAKLVQKELLARARKHVPASERPASLRDYY